MDNKNFVDLTDEEMQSVSGGLLFTSLTGFLGSVLNLGTSFIGGLLGSIFSLANGLLGSLNSIFTAK